MKKFKEGTSFMIEVFKKKFWVDEKGLPRKWPSMEEKDIDRLFRDSREDVIMPY